MSFLCSTFCVSKKEELTNEFTISENNSPRNSYKRGSKRSRKNSFFPNTKTNSRANVKIANYKPYTTHKDLLDVTKIYEQPSVRNSPVMTTQITPTPKKKMFKKPFKPFVDIEVNNALKKVSKRKSDVEYDPDIVYGMPSKLDENVFHGDKIDPLNKYIENDKIKINLNFGYENSKSKEVESTEKKVNIFKPEYSKIKKFTRNRNFDILLNQSLNNNDHIYPVTIFNQDIIDKNDSIENIEKISKDNNINKGNSSKIFTEEITMEKNKIMSSCTDCEEFYKIIIFQNKPVKIFKCQFCKNFLNSDSLDFFYEKYKNELRNKVKSKIQRKYNVDPQNLENLLWEDEKSRLKTKIENNKKFENFEMMKRMRELKIHELYKSRDAVGKLLKMTSLTDNLEMDQYFPKESKNSNAI